MMIQNKLCGNETSVSHIKISNCLRSMYMQNLKQTGDIIIFITQVALSWYNMIASFIHASFIMVCNQYVTAETTLDHCDETHYE